MQMRMGSSSIIVLSISVGLIVTGISLLSVKWSIGFTQADLDSTKCIGCDCPYLKVRISFGESQEYCCPQDIDVNRQLLSCFMINSCKSIGLKRLDSYTTNSRNYLIAGVITLSVGLLVFIFIFIKLIKIRGFNIRLQRRMEVLRQQQAQAEADRRWLENPNLDSQDFLKSLITQSQDQCSICIQSLKSMKVIKLDCLHEFHKICIRQWMKTSRKCPLCRKNIA